MMDDDRQRANARRVSVEFCLRSVVRFFPFFILRPKFADLLFARALVRPALRVRHGLLIVVVAASAFAVQAGPVAAQTPREIQKIAEQAIQKLHLQTELPREPEKTRFTVRLPPEAIWLVIAVAIGVLLYSLRDMLPIWRLPGSAAWTAEDDLAGEAKAGTPAAVLSTADELASQGRFVEAIHVLLLQGLAHLRQRLDQQFADSLTSREILRTAELSDAGRASLRDIINRVELTYFGEHPAALPDYVACRASFNTLAQALHGSAPA
jgi:hypothetical protein